MKLHLATAAAIGALMLGPALAAQDEAPEGAAPGVVGDLPSAEPGSERIEDVHKLDATEGMTEEVPDMKPDEQAAAADETEDDARQAASDQPTTDPGSEVLEDVHKLDATEGMTDQVPPMTPDDEQQTGQADAGAEADRDAQAELDSEADAEAQAGANAGAQSKWDTPWDPKAQ
jgi:hypothetical protein